MGEITLPQFLRDVCNVPLVRSGEQVSVSVALRSELIGVVVVVEFDSICLIENYGQGVIQTLKEHFRKYRILLRPPTVFVEHLECYSTALYFFEGIRLEEEVVVSFFNTRFVCGVIPHAEMKMILWEGFTVTPTAKLVYKQGGLVTGDELHLLNLTPTV